MQRRIVVSGTGCCLVDLLYNQIDFNAPLMRPFLSVEKGDGGLMPGKLVFREEFETFSGMPVEEFIRIVTAERDCDAMNVGGPSVVSLIHAAQLTVEEECEVRFFGLTGTDAHGSFLRSALAETPLNLNDLGQVDRSTPSTVVLSDPGYDGGAGERMFINSIGAAWDYLPDRLGEHFYDADITVFGGTALVPRIHENLTSLLSRARSSGCLTVVNTVFDFRNERLRPHGRWPLGASDESYRYTDLLITDREEAFGLSGCSDFPRAIAFFRGKGLGALMITDGPNPVHLYSDGSVFESMGPMTMPVSGMVSELLRTHREGDTTGAGDNFTGGVLASLVGQLSQGVSRPDLGRMCAWGIASGGFACFYLGGTFLERSPGEKLNRIKPIFDDYIRKEGGPSRP
jgi:sugar/nucleoside kinase (ribokinase family)